MFKEKILSNRNLENFDYEATKQEVINYFEDIEKCEWEYAKIRAQKGLTSNYDLSVEFQKQPYTPIKKDYFNLMAKENREEQLKKYLTSYYWATSILSVNEKLYIQEYFINHKYQDELADLLGFNSCDNHAFRRLRKSAIYKFADFLDLIVRNEGKNEEKSFN